MSQCLVCDKTIDIEFGNGEQCMFDGLNFEGFVCSSQCQSDYESGIRSGKDSPGTGDKCEHCGRRVISGGYYSGNYDLYCNSSCYRAWQKELASGWR